MRLVPVPPPEGLRLNYGRSGERSLWPEAQRLDGAVGGVRTTSAIAVCADYKLRSSTGAVNAIHCRLSESLATLVEEAAEAIRQNMVSQMDKTNGPISNTDDNNAEREQDSVWLLV